MSRFEKTILKDDEGRTVKDILKKEFSLSKRLRAKLKNEESLVLVNGKQAQGWFPLSEGDVITVTFPEEHSSFLPQNIPFTIIYEDSDLLCIDKPAGLVCHPTKGHPLGTLSNGIQHYMEQSCQNFKIRFINRLDMDTSGLVLVSKNSHAQYAFTKASEQGKTIKKYIALVNGIIIEDEGIIDLPIGQDDPSSLKRNVTPSGLESTTHFKTLKRFEKNFTLLELTLKTGRTHQIRVHLSHKGFPVTGDYLYGGECPTIISRQALHASSLSFPHPLTKEQITLNAPLPSDIKRAIEILS
ncbi:MAG: RluA family pseudouridine synthase [Anaerovoracaceae bacterium]